VRFDDRPAYYALRRGGWRDYLTLLHPPYTAWHLSYVAIGAAVAPHVVGWRLALSLGAFFLGVGLSAHAMDELSGRPLGTAIPTPVLVAIAVVGLAGGVALGILGAALTTWWLLAFVAFGGFIVVAYNLELAGGRFHSDLWFAAAWGAFPALTSYVTQAETVRWPAVAVSVGCLCVSAAQRHLSKEVRRLRREVASVEGRLVMRDGSTAALDRGAIRAGPEAALRAMATGMSLLGAGLVAARLV
jgi:hypothetical protein